MNLRELIDAVRDEGYSQANAEARVCQDIVLKAIDESAFANHITVKGGVVMRSITGDARRATQDMDLDFIRYFFGMIPSGTLSANSTVLMELRSGSPESSKYFLSRSIMANVFLSPLRMKPAIRCEAKLIWAFTSRYRLNRMNTASMSAWMMKGPAS